MTAPLNRAQRITEDGIMTVRFQQWQNEVSDQVTVFRGSGSPEGVVEAGIDRLYIDTAGGAGAVLYVKRDADSAGDRKSGWILV